MCQVSLPADDKDVWVLDSGASDHMSHRREWFQNFREGSIGVTIGNGAKIVAQGKGDINILVFNGDEWIKKYITDVLYVPEIHLNLFSSGKAMDRGYQLRSDNERCQLLSDSDVVAVGARYEKLFRMFFKVVELRQNEWAIANVAVKKVSLRVWHERLGHQHAAHVKKFLQGRDIVFINEEFACEACVYGKHHRGSFKSREEISTTCGEIVHADVCGPMEENSLGGSRYFLLLKDDFSHFRCVYFLNQKSEVASNIKKFVKMIQKEHGHNIRVFRSDNGTEFVNGEVNKFFSDMGIRHQRTVPYTPEQNGCAEREMRTIVESARTMIHAKRMEKRFWAEAVNTAVHVLNRSGTSNVADKSPYELWYNKPSKIEHLRIFGSEVFVYVPKEKRRKFDPKAARRVFVGYDNNSNGYRVWNSKTNKSEVTRDVVFLFEKSMAVLDIDDVGEKSNEDEMQVQYEMEANGANTEAAGAEIEITPEDQTNDGAICSIDNKNIIKDRLRDRERRVPSRRQLSFDETASHVAMLVVNEEPKTYEQAIESDDHKQWKKAMDEEYDSLIKNCTRLLVKPPKDQKVIDNRWVYRLKQNTDGSIDCYKARLVVRGFTQQYGVEYLETFSPVVKFTSIRTILALAASKRMFLRQFDVKSAFLNGDLGENVFMKQPFGYDDGSGKVCKLIKSLYGLKQASRCWNKKFTSFISNFDLRASVSDPCVFVHNGDDGMIILAIYVDDGLVAAEDKKAILQVIDHLRKEFEIKVFEAKCFLGLEIDQQSDVQFMSISRHMHRKYFIVLVLKIAMQ